VAVIQRGHRVLYHEAHTLVDEPADAQLTGTRKPTLAHLTTIPLLIVDDLGMRKLPPIAAEDPLAIVMRRYERASTLLTSNRPLEDWGKLLGDTALLDRLLHHAHASRAARAAGARASTASGLPLGVMTSMTRRAQAPSATIWKGAATGVFRKTRLALPWAARAHNTPAWAPTPMAGFAPSTYGRFCSVYRGIGCRCSADAVTKPDPSSNSLSLEDSGSISELDMPKGRPSRPRTWVEGDSRRERPVTAGAIVIPIHFDIVVSLPRR
jgi:hypothetical protein